MKALSLSIALGAVLALMGCSTPKPNTPSTPTKSNISLPSIQHFECQNGIDVAVKHLGNDQIELTTSPDAKRAVLTQVSSGSGERYVGNTGLWGNGGEWHQKGGEVYFEYIGVHGGKPKHTTCTAK